VDEVLAVGDVEFQRKCLGKMEDVARQQGRTVIFVSHQMAAIQNLCSRCIFLHQGRMMQQGNTSEIVDAYLSYTRTLTVGDLAERKDRKGRGEATVDVIQIRNEQGEEVQAAVSGSTVILRAFFSVKDGKVIRNCRVTLVVMRQTRPYFVVSTDLVDKTPLHLSGKGWIEFVVPDWPLSGGTYHISSFIASDNDGACQDWVEDAGSINVIDGDFFGTGKLYHMDWQGASVLVRHSWSLQRDDREEPERSGVPSVELLA